jgi:putative FmdB family regulatory protein
MPTYTYQCAECGVAFDQFQKFSEDPLTECRSCDGTVKRVIHPVGIVFKGAGWYITDSRGGTSDATVPAAPSTDAEPAATAVAAAPATTTTESKPASSSAEPKSAVESKAASSS